MALGKSVSELLESMDAQELTAWMAYDRIEPFGESRADMRTAAQTTALLNVQRKRGSDPLKPSDFMPQYDKRYLPKKSNGAEQKLKAFSKAAKRG